MARDFSGSSEYLLSTTTPVTGPPCTFACWFNPDRLTANETLLSVGESSANSNVISLRLRGALTAHPVEMLAQRNGTFPAGAVSAHTTTGFAQNVWQHAAGVYTSNDTDGMAVFLNAGSKGTGTMPGTPVGLDRIGVGVEAKSTLSLQYDGKIAEPAIWNVALDDAEIAALANGYSPLALTHRLGNLVFYAPLVRDIVSLKGPALTATGTTVYPHPRVILPRRRTIYLPAPAAGGGEGQVVETGLAAQTFLGNVAVDADGVFSVTGLGGVTHIGSVTTDVSGNRPIIFIVC